MMMDISTLISKVRKLEIATKGMTKQLFSGEYHAAFKGKGMSFSEVRAYTWGDDVRNIDWNVTARTLETHVKVFEEERELTVMLLLDMSGSSFFGSGEVLKHQLMAEIAALLAYSAISNHDKVGAILFTDKIETYIPPQKGRKILLRILREMIHFQNTSKSTQIAHALQYFYNIEKKRSIAFLLSDFIDRQYEQPLAMVAKKHDVIGIRIFDHRESDIPDMGLAKFKDAETGNTILADTSDAWIRAAYTRNFAAAAESAKQTFTRAGADFFSISTGDDFIRILSAFFKKRSGR